MRIAFLVFTLTLVSCTYRPSQDSTKGHISDITEAVYASVTIRPEVTYHPQTSRSGIIEEIFIGEGDLVKKGDPLFQLSISPDMGNRLTNAQLNLGEAKANLLGNDNLLRNIETEMESIQQQLVLDSTNLARQQRLWQQNIGKKIDLDRATRSYQATLSQLRGLEYSHSQTLTTLENNYKKAVNLLQTEREQLSDFTVLAKMDGKVYRIHKEVGELLSPQEQLAEIGSAADFLVEMDIDEVDIARISLGDTVVISLEAYPNETFTAQIDKVSPMKDELTQTFRVESRFIEAPRKLYYGLSGEASIIADQRKGALLIPTDYLLEGNRVLTREGEVGVSVGVKNMEFVEIISGIDSSVVLLKPDQQ
ncbi:MAG: HlyD family efflux transporter periplasmic adaptor subunit [Cyanothece sp. SIO1E1]|nr:HlyD family efflux transporter periplasmic adaptor subunit [Cyanothece sp. SIO1E1]